MMEKKIMNAPSIRWYQPDLNLASSFRNKIHFLPGFHPFILLSHLTAHRLLDQELPLKINLEKLTLNPAVGGELFSWLSCAGALGVLQAGLIPHLVQKLKTELDDIQELILDTLSNCLRVEVSQALAAGAVTILKGKLTHPSAAVRSKAALVLLEISSHPEGKIPVCEDGVIPVLVSLLEDTAPEVQASATGALMFAVVTPQGRSSAMGAAAIPPLLKLVAEETSKARLKAIKTLTLLAELPEGREVLLGHTGTFQQCLDDPREAVKRAAQIALRVIEWKPLSSRDLF